MNLNEATSQNKKDFMPLQSIFQKLHYLTPQSLSVKGLEKAKQQENLSE